MESLHKSYEVVSLSMCEWQPVVQDVEILPPAAFYAVNWRQADWLFNAAFREQVFFNHQTMYSIGTVPTYQKNQPD